LLPCGIDLDTCRDPTTEIFQDWAQEVINRFETYAEVSPNGKGVKLFFTHANTDTPAIQKLFNGQSGRQLKNGGGKHCPAIEVYRAGRYFTVTDESIGLFRHGCQRSPHSLPLVSGLYYGPARPKDGGSGWSLAESVRRYIPRF
jgi:hypothetical protein